MVSQRRGWKHMAYSRFRKQVCGKMSRALQEGMGWCISGHLLKEKEFFICAPLSPTT